MPLTRSFKETVRARAQRDPAFREALLAEAVESLLFGGAETGKTIIRDYINATVGFEALAEAVGTPAKSLMRMFGPHGNPSAQPFRRPRPAPARLRREPQNPSRRLTRAVSGRMWRASRTPGSPAAINPGETT